MVYFFVRPSLIFALVLVLLFFVVSTHAAEVVKVDVICKQTSNYSFCSSVLNSKPGGAAGADLISLAQYTIEAAKALEEKLKASRVPHEVHKYPGNGHAFMNSSLEGIKRRKSMGLADEVEVAIQLAWSCFQ